MRLLREADVIPTGGRGTGGYAMRPRDAAALTVATVVTNILKDTVEITKDFLALPIRWREVRGPARPLQPGGALPGLSQDAIVRKFGLGRIPDGADLHSAVATMIEMFIRGEMFPDLAISDFDPIPDSELPLDYEKQLVVRFFLPVPCVTILYMANKVLMERMVFGGIGERVTPETYGRLLARAGKEGALEQLRVLPAKSFERIAKSVGEEGLISALSPAPSRRKKRKLTESDEVAK
jgi:hypothetical protein